MKFCIRCENQLYRGTPRLLKFFTVPLFTMDEMGSSFGMPIGTKNIVLEQYCKECAAVDFPMNMSQFPAQ